MLYSRSFRALHFAVRPRVLAKYLGQAFVALAVLTTIPALVSLLGGRPDIALRYLAVILVFGGLGGAGARLRCTDRLQTNEALAVSALVFTLSSVGMAFPMMGYGISPLDALFEAVSGVTTTGLSTLGSIEGRPRAFLFARSWLQWVGGLGVVVLALAVMIPSGVAAKRLGFGDREAADYVGGTRGHARRILIVYVSLTVAGFGLLWAVGMGWFDALAHALAAISTGGFSTRDASLAAMHPLTQAAVSTICMAGAVSFSLYYRASIGSFLRDGQLWLLLGLTAAASAGVAGSLIAAGHATASAWSEGAGMAVSAQSTAGFSTLATGELPASGKLVLIASMLVGGEVGSTAGGLKVLRFAILAQLVVARVLRASMPPGSHLRLRLDGTRLRPAEIEGAAALLITYIGVILFSWLSFVAFGHDPIDSLFDVVSALGTVGLSAGTVGPTLEPFLKGVLCLDMLMGRVEIFAFLVLIFPGTWIGRRRPPQ